MVNKTIDGAATESWLRRALVEGASDASTTVASDSAAVAPGKRSRDGWDPWEVWLRHIDQPRRLFAARRLKSVD